MTTVSPVARLTPQRPPTSLTLTPEVVFPCSQLTRYPDSVTLFLSVTATSVRPNAFVARVQADLQQL